jgi:xanthine/uracil/vitamin C permease (AzgA family)
LIGMVPPEATAAALIAVGYLMISALSEAEDEAEIEEGVAARGRAKIAGIDFHDIAIGLPAALVIMLMPFCGACRRRLRSPSSSRSCRTT